MVQTDNEYELLNKKFEKFFILNFPKVKNFAYMLLKSEKEAEDIAQDIFMKLWEQPQLWGDHNIKNYLYTITKNKILNRIKHRKVERLYQQQSVNIQCVEEILENPFEQIYYDEILLILKLSLEQMPERRREIFKMNRLQGMKNEEIAQKLHLSIRTVEHHLYLALSELKKILISALILLSL